MKKFFAALLAILTAAALAGCDNSADEQLDDDISEDTSAVTEAAETSSESVLETVSEIETETEITETLETGETMTETSAEAAAKRHTDTENRGNTYSASKEDLFGTWYAVDFVGMDNAVFTFGEDGIVSTVRDGVSESGTYTVTDGLVEVISNDGEDWEAWAALFDGDVLILKFIGWNYDLIREEHKPYESGQTVGDYLYETGHNGIEFVLSKEKPVLAEQEDLLGVWKASNGSEEGLIFFDKHGYVGMDDDLLFIPAEVVNGVLTVTGEMPKNVYLSDDDRRLYLCGEKAYTIVWEETSFGKLFRYDDQTIIMERYEQEVLTADMFDGSAAADDEAYYYFNNGKFYVYANDIENAEDIKEYEYKIDGNRVILPIDGTETEFAYYLWGDYLYLIGENKYLSFQAIKMTERSN